MQSLLAKIKEDSSNKKRKVEISSENQHLIAASVVSNTTESFHSSTRTKNDCNVIMQGMEGFSNSITHYYHFLFSGLFPIIELHLSNPNLNFMISTDIGPMKSILCELPITIIGIVGPEHTLTKDDTNLPPNSYLLPSYDIFRNEYYDSYKHTFSKKKILIILNYFKETIPNYLKNLPIYDIILIERTNQEKHYQNTELKTKFQVSGSTTRSIANHEMLASTLLSIYGSNKFINLQLERSNIYYQYYMFSNCKIVIGQHGAALSNIIFSLSTNNIPITVIEILPQSKYEKIESLQIDARSHFKNLSKHLNYNYYQIEQTTDHSYVNINEIMEILSKVYHLN